MGTRTLSTSKGHGGKVLETHLSVRAGKAEYPVHESVVSQAGTSVGEPGPAAELLADENFTTDGRLAKKPWVEAPTMISSSPPVQVPVDKMRIERGLGFKDSDSVLLMSLDFTKESKSILAEAPGILSPDDYVRYRDISVLARGDRRALVCHHANGHFGLENSHI